MDKEERLFHDRAAGALVGLAVGDALGAPVEFLPPGGFEPVKDFRGGGTWGLEAGQWTDDTSMALCLAESLVHCGGFDPRDQMERYLRWYREGYLSSTGECFDIGNATREALERFERTGDPFSGSTDPRKAGNGSLMRLVPVPVFWHDEPERAIRYAAESSRTTHGADTTVDACRYYAGLLCGVLGGAEKDELLSPFYSPVLELWEREPLSSAIAEVAAGSFLEKEPPEIQGTGYVVKSLEAALWAFAKGESFEESVLLAVNLGDDTDTTGAICGQLAGAYWGESGIPERWKQGLAPGIGETVKALVEAFQARGGE